MNYPISSDKANSWLSKQDAALTHVGKREYPETIQKKAFIAGFTKRAAKHGVSKHQAHKLLQANPHVLEDLVASAPTSPKDSKKLRAELTRLLNQNSLQTFPSPKGNTIELYSKHQSKYTGHWPYAEFHERDGKIQPGAQSGWDG